MPELRSMVFVIENDRSLRQELRRLIYSVGLRVQLLESAEEFLGLQREDVPSCLLLDVRLSGISGLELQRRLGGAHHKIPLIFITSHGDVSMSVTAMKAGAVDFLQKPFRDQELLDAVCLGLERDRSRLELCEEDRCCRVASNLSPFESGKLSCW